MPVAGPAEYHPYAACLMFQACHNSKTVWANLEAAVEFGTHIEAKGLDIDQAMHNTALVRGT